MTRVWLVAAAVAASVGVLAQEPPPPQRQPSFRGGVSEAGSLSNGGTLSPRQLAASLRPRKTALRREQRQRHSSFLFRFRLFRLFSFPIGSSLPFRHKSFLSISFRSNLQNTIWGGFRIPHRKSEKFKVF